MDWDKIRQGIKEPDFKAIEKAKLRQSALLKPMGSLGKLEDISILFAGITGKVMNTADKKIHFLFGADNGVYEEGIAASPQEFTHLLMAQYAAGGCGINVICEENDVALFLIDIGVIGSFTDNRIINRKLMPGTRNFLKTTAMSRETAEKAMETGFEYARYAKENGYQIIGNGEVGMGNTTTAAACIMAALQNGDADKMVGRGAGLTDESYLKKKAVILEALNKHAPDPSDPVDILYKVGGLDIAAMTGLYIGAAYYRLPIVVDGVISIAAALLAYRYDPKTVHYMIASHVSEEPAYRAACEKLGLNPILNLNMRLGEGTGCPIAMKVIDTALSVMRNMKTFQDVKAQTDYRKDITM